MRVDKTEYVKKLHLVVLLQQAFYQHRKKSAWDVMRILTVDKQLDLNQIKTYFLFLSVYFNESNQAKHRRKFYSANGIYDLISDLSKSYKKDKIFLSVNRPLYLKSINQLKKAGLIANNPFKRERDIYPALFFNVKYSKKRTWNRTTIQPMGEYANVWSIEHFKEDPDNQWLFLPKVPASYPIELTRPEEKNIFPVTLTAVKDILEDFLLSREIDSDEPTMTQHFDVFYNMVFNKDTRPQNMTDLLTYYLFDTNQLDLSNLLFAIPDYRIENYLAKMHDSKDKYIEISEKPKEKKYYDKDLSERLKKERAQWFKEGKNEKDNKRKSAQ